MIGYMPNGERPRTGLGCLSTIVGLFVLAVVIGLVFFVGFIALGVFAVLLVIGLVILAVDRVMLALSPKRRERRANQNAAFIWRYGQIQSGNVIDTTATLDEPERESDSDL